MNTLQALENGDSFVVEVTAEHIANGSRTNLYYDPLATALKEKLKDFGVTGAMVGWGYANTYHENNIVIFWHIEPRTQIQSWLKLWDMGKRVAPITFKAIFDQYQDRTPKPPRTKGVRRYKTFSQNQAELGLK